ncbi:MAG: hypothetical protein JSR85_03400 [Proteobacteria bacterium]|nr:hypothetical protein [Pseudomonadota bacterium]
MVETQALKIPRKSILLFYLLEVASLIMGMVLGAIITLFLPIHLNSKLIDSRALGSRVFDSGDTFSSSYSFLGPYKDLAVIDIAQLYNEHMQFLESMSEDQPLDEGSQEYPRMHMLVFLEDLYRAIDQVRDDKKVILLDAKAVSQLPDYTDEVKKYLHLLEDSHEENSLQEKESAS